MEEKKGSVDEMIDLCKELYDCFNDSQNDILFKQKLEFNLFYEYDQKYRALLEEIGNNQKKLGATIEKPDYSKTTPEESAKAYKEYLDAVREINRSINKKIQQRERFDIFEHLRNRKKQVSYFVTWIQLFIADGMPLTEASALVRETFRKLKLMKARLEKDIPLMQSTKEKSIFQLSKLEEMAINHNFLRIILKPIVERQLQIIKPFNKYYKSMRPELKEASTELPRKMEKPFSEYLLHTQREELAKLLKQEFKTEKGKGIRLMIEALACTKPPIINIGNRKQTDIYNAIKLYFERYIGTYQSIFDFKFDQEIHKPDLESIKQRVDFLLKSLENRM